MEDSGSEDDETTGLTRRKGSLSRRRTAPGMTQQSTDMAASSEFGRSLRRRSTTADDFGEQSMMFSSGLYSSGIMLKKRIISLYVQLCELKSYVQLNKTGFRKVLKKFDKILDKELRVSYMAAHVDTAYPFKDETRKVVEENISKMEDAYAEVVTGGDEQLARKDLRSHLREHVVWERNTVWRELIGIERRGEAARLGQSLLGQGQNAAPKRLQGDDDKAPAFKQVNTPLGRLALPSWLASTSMLTLIISLVAFFLLLFLPIMERPEQQNCLAMLVFVSLLWATEVCLSQLFHHSNSSNLLYPDNSSVCDVASHPLLVCSPEHCSNGGPRSAPEASELQGRNLGHLRCHVDAGHHAAPRWLHPSRGSVQVQNRQTPSHAHLEQGRHSAANRLDRQHVRGRVCVHAD